jgi:hypothetical protein
MRLFEIGDMVVRPAFGNPDQLVIVDFIAGGDGNRTHAVCRFNTIDAIPIDRPSRI